MKNVCGIPLGPVCVSVIPYPKEFSAHLVIPTVPIQRRIFHNDVMIMAYDGNSAAQ